MLLPRSLKRVTGLLRGALPLLALFAPPLSAATPDAVPADETLDETIDEIVVVADRQPRPRREIAARVTVITNEDLDALLALTADDAFRYTPGIDAENAGTRFGSEGLNIRGIGGDRVTVLVDGVPLSDQFDVGSFSNATRDFLDTGLVQRIEVLHGPASALYGSAAIGGVVAATTPDPGDLVGGNGSGGRLRGAWRDADAALQATLLAGLGDSDRGLLFGVSRRDGHELPPAGAGAVLDFRDSERHSALLKGATDLRGGDRLVASLLYQDARTRSDLRSMLGSGRYRSTTALLGDDDYVLRLLGVAWEFGAPGEFVEDGVLRVYRQQSLTRQRTQDVRGAAARPVAIDRYFEFEQEIDGVELNLGRSLAIGDSEHRLGLGLEFRERRTEEMRDGTETGLEDGASTSVILGEAFPLRDFPRSRSREWGLYLQDVVDAGPLTITAAVRADRYSLAPLADPMYADNYPFAEPVGITDADLSPKLGVTWRASDAVDLYLQYTHGFRAPPYEDANIGLEIPFFNYRAVPNPDLRSERSDSLEAGLRWHGDALEFELGAFRSDYDDFIASRVNIGTDEVSGRTLFQAQNIERAVISGVEAGWTWQPAESLRIDGSLYRARGENRDSGAPLDSVGPGRLTAGLHWSPGDGRRSAALRVTAVEAWDDRDSAAGPVFEPPGHALLDLYLVQRVGERLVLRAALMNATDRVAWHWSSVRGLAADDLLIPWLAGPGRHLTLGFNLAW